MKDLLAFMIEGLVESREDVQIEEETSGNETRFKIRVAKEDMGRVIGKRGKTANAVRCIMSAAASRKKQRVTVEFVE